MSGEVIGVVIVFSHLITYISITYFVFIEYCVLTTSGQQCKTTIIYMYIFAIEYH